MYAVYKVHPKDPSSSEPEGMESLIIWPGLYTEWFHSRKRLKKTSGRHQDIYLDQFSVFRCLCLSLCLSVSLFSLLHVCLHLWVCLYIFLCISFSFFPCNVQWLSLVRRTLVLIKTCAFPFWWPETFACSRSTRDTHA